MGTAAVFAIENERKNPIIIGMTSDGFPQNLKFIAGLIKKLVESSPDFSLEDPKKVNEILEKTAASSDSLFLDDYRNAQWVSYSARFNPISGSLQIYSGQFEELIESVNFEPVTQLPARLFAYVVKESSGEESGIYSEQLEITATEQKTLTEAGEEVVNTLFKVDSVLNIILTYQDNLLESGKLDRSLVVKELKKEKFYSYFN